MGQALDSLSVAIIVVESLSALSDCSQRPCVKVS
jgi:hypothetical protein